ncbi:hypothetical protein AAIR98_001580 [Elusimicrobium simillimum]|uniref:carbohydrate porin n=1 Tax=Elusimicrobium simillimum TaxID=3143438 RepID=UPI003C6EE7E0
MIKLNKVLVLFLAALFSVPAFGAGGNTAGLLEKYSGFKENLENDYGIMFGASVSYMAQRAAPSGKQTAWQTMYFPYLEWNFLRDGSLGSGTLALSDIFVHYWGADAAALEERIGVASYINDYSENSNLFYRFTYSHTLPGAMDWLSVTFGQYSLFDFDGGAYNNDQQVSLINYAMSQNAAATYPWASLGAYVTVAPFEGIEFSAGYQDANNMSGKQLDADTAFAGEYLGFAYAAYSKDDRYKYSFLTYYQPSVEEQEQYSAGWSLNAEQSLSDKIVVFGRAAGTKNTPAQIKNSFMLGMAYKDPLNRSEFDSIVLGASYNRLERANMEEDAYYRTGETVAEVQWNFAPIERLIITPDLQVFPRAGLSGSDSWVFVSSLRFTVVL